MGLVHFSHDIWKILARKEKWGGGPRSFGKVGIRVIPKVTLSSTPHVTPYPLF